MNLPRPLSLDSYPARGPSLFRAQFDVYCKNGEYTYSDWDLIFVNPALCFLTVVCGVSLGISALWGMRWLVPLVVRVSLILPNVLRHKRRKAIHVNKFSF
jgi:hypothetical protein